MLFFLLFLRRESLQIPNVSSTLKDQKQPSESKHTEFEQFLQINNSNSTQTEAKTNLVPTVSILSLLLLAIIIFVGFVLFYCRQQKYNEQEIETNNLQSNNAISMALIA